MRAGDGKRIARPEPRRGRKRPPEPQPGLLPVLYSNGERVEAALALIDSAGQQCRKELQRGEGGEGGEGGEAALSQISPKEGEAEALGAAGAPARSQGRVVARSSFLAENESNGSEGELSDVSINETRYTFREGVQVLSLARGEEQVGKGQEAESGLTLTALQTSFTPPATRRAGDSMQESRVSGVPGARGKSAAESRGGTSARVTPRAKAGGNCEFAGRVLLGGDAHAGPSLLDAEILDLAAVQRARLAARRLGGFAGYPADSEAYGPRVLQDPVLHGKVQPFGVSAIRAFGYAFGDATWGADTALGSYLASHEILTAVSMIANCDRSSVSVDEEAVWAANEGSWAVAVHDGGRACVRTFLPPPRRYWKLFTKPGEKELGSFVVCTTLLQYGVHFFALELDGIGALEDELSEVDGNKPRALGRRAARSTTISWKPALPSGTRKPPPTSAARRGDALAENLPLDFAKGRAGGLKRAAKRQQRPRGPQRPQQHGGAPRKNLRPAPRRRPLARARALKPAPCTPQSPPGAMSPANAAPVFSSPGCGVPIPLSEKLGSPLKSGRQDFQPLAPRTSLGVVSMSLLNDQRALAATLGRVPDRQCPKSSSQRAKVSAAVKPTAEQSSFAPAGRRKSSGPGKAPGAESVFLDPGDGRIYLGDVLGRTKPAAHTAPPAQGPCRVIVIVDCQKGRAMFLPHGFAFNIISCPISVPCVLAVRLGRAGERVRIRRPGEEVAGYG